MRVVITGGAGYVGFSLVRTLANLSEIDSILVVDNLARRNYALFVSGPHGPVPVEFRKVDILDGLSLDQALEGADAVVHLAAHVSTPSADSDAHVHDQVNNWGSAQVARSIEKQASVQRVVYLSSFAVYGDRPEPFTEDSTPVPTSAYGISKLSGEAHFRRLGDRSVTVLRAANVFGFNQAIRFDSVVNAMCFSAWTQRNVRVDGDGDQTRPFIDVETVALAIGKCLTSSDVAGTWNLATHNASINEVADLIVDLIPNCDRIHVNREMRMRNVTLELPVPSSAHFDIASPTLGKAIAELITALGG
jgi:UDP-glucose 4-epimerase